MRSRIVVGVSGSPSSVAALAWSLRLAAGRTWGVDVVTAWPAGSDVFVHEVPGHVSAPRTQAAQAQDTAMRACLDLWRDMSFVSLSLENARPVDALLHHAAGATLIVVGTPSGQRSSGPGVSQSGSTHEGVAEVCARSGPCPVVMVDPTGRAVPHPGPGPWSSTPALTAP